LRLQALKLGALSVIGIVLVACGGSSSSTTQSLASDQTLKFPIFGEFGTLDPGQLDAEVDSEIAQNIFNGPLRYDNNLNIIPDIATDVPSTSNGGVSSDGLTYTFKLRKDVTFSNGDKVTAKDMIYSWNRAAALQGPYGSNLSAITGYSDVTKYTKGLKPSKKAADTAKAAFNKTVEDALAASDPKVMMKGLTSPDPYTVVVKLDSAAGWFLSAVTLESTTGMIVDEKAIQTNPRDWWTVPASLVGTGPFKMTQHTAKQSADFAAVDNWWGSPKPTLKAIHVDILDPSSQSTAIASFEQGKYDIVGYGGWSAQPKADILRIQQTANEKSQLLLQPKVRTTWVSFNVNPSHPAGGPFTVDKGQKAKDLRTAFALAVDKTKLQSVVCQNVTCSAASGGLITKGLKGYLGDGTDPLGKFDATKAKQLLTGADPTGTLTAGLKYSYNTGSPNDDVATFLQDQWKTNLGVNVGLDPHPDATAFINDRQAGKFVMARDGWQADYDHPQDWFDNLWGKMAEDSTANTSGYAPNATDQYNVLLTKADAEPLATALPTYKQISELLSTDVVDIPLYYSVGQFLFKPYAKGAGTNNFFDHFWNEISILQH
jgi:oligopeptide transport system substrate-binding protein